MEGRRSCHPPTMSSMPPALDDLDGIAKICLHKTPHFSVVRSQIEQRAQLVNFWGIGKGEKVLEIGCGQGDCTAVLAAAVGEEGSVTAIDPASLDYGTSTEPVHPPAPSEYAWMR